ncbi:related to ubiquitin-protein ligase 1 [Melanopsichium pennsylvanicum]|uniref:HECT-type E3 ubiquitin transferase n=2 Tax=Melanopsichium pennsylvanicum TaxID=63383 RepID=A0AAJ4XP44_9BASI|nr:related to ubiquitin-protein ligase 1 [Melanopsichium pennsylvanicum 4]SNX85924.1 related to ubiquitin-protein ligase 1 [Melanopsichium pennsylvanicum]
MPEQTHDHPLGAFIAIDHRGIPVHGSMQSMDGSSGDPSLEALNMFLRMPYPGEARASPSGRKPDNAHSEALKKKREEDQAKLSQIYKSFHFDALWSKLSEVLSRMKNDPGAAQILLPLIESMMVVSQHVTSSEPESSGSASASASGSGSGSSSEARPPHSRQNAGGEPKSRKEAMEDDFFAFTEKHRKILNIMVRQNPALMSGSFAMLVRNPKVLDFDNKKNYFTQQLHKGRRDHYTPLSLSVRRNSVFEDSYRYFSRKNGPDVKHGKLNVRFNNEEGIDAGGVTREWFQVLARAMFNPDYALFQPCAADRTTYQPNRMSYVNPDHLSFFKFVGRIIGKAIYDGRLLDAYFTRSFYKHILGKPVDYRDIESVDPEYFKSLEWMLNNDITDILDFTFSVDDEEFGETKVIELKPDGTNIPVSEENKHEYVRLVTEQRLTKSIKSQIDAFLGGFNEIIPADLIRIFSEQELELLISGLPDIDVDAWKNNTELHGYGSGDAVIQWWWRAVRSFDQTEKAKLLQFITGTSKVPLEGFAHLQGVQGTQRFNIHKAYGADRLPAAHTCFNQLDLPQYDSYEKLRSSLLLAMNEGGEGFGFA